MKRKLLFLLLGVSAAALLTACQSREDEEINNEPSASAESDLGTAVFESEDVLDLDSAVLELESETERDLDPITPSDYLVKDVEEYITPGNLEGLSVTRYTYEVNDELLQEQIDMELSMYGEEVEVDRASQEGDTVYVDLTATIEGSSDEPVTESTYYILGDQENGEAFDQELTGVKAGDTLEFTLTFDSEILQADWAGQTVSFAVTVTSVDEVNTPEYNDDFVSEYTGYATTEEYEAALREALTEEYEELSDTDVYSSLIEAAMNESVISTPPEELYNDCRAEVIDSYAVFLDTTEEEEILELAGITEAELESEIMSLAGRRLLISYICGENDLSVTEDEYVSYVEEMAMDYGFYSAYELEQTFLRSYLVWSLYEEKAAEFLYQSADVVSVSYDEMADAAEEIEESELDAEIPEETGIE